MSSGPIVIWLVCKRRVDERAGPSREIQESGAEKPELSHEVQWPSSEKTEHVVKRPDRAVKWTWGNWNRNWRAGTWRGLAGKWKAPAVCCRHWL